MRIWHPRQPVKLAFLPALPMRVWFCLWGIAAALMVVHFIGWFVAQWWEFSPDLGLLPTVMFLLLTMTPLDFPPKAYYAFRPRSLAERDAPWLPCSEAEALEALPDPQLLVRRCVIHEGAILSDEILEAPPKERGA